jgi:hypothetical protein
MKKTKIFLSNNYFLLIPESLNNVINKSIEEYKIEKKASLIHSSLISGGEEYSKEDLKVHIINSQQYLNDLKIEFEVDHAYYSKFSLLSVSRLLADPITRRVAGLTYYSLLIDDEFKVKGYDLAAGKFTEVTNSSINSSLLQMQELITFNAARDMAWYAGLTGGRERLNLATLKKVVLAEKFHDICDSDYNDVVVGLLPGVNVFREIEPFRSYVLNNAEEAGAHLSYGAQYSKNIELMPEFSDITTKISSLLFDGLNLSQLDIVLKTFYWDPSEFLRYPGDVLVQQAMMHPALLFVLGNALFLKIVIPTSFRMYKVRGENIYERYLETNWQKLIKDSVEKTKRKRIERNTIPERVKKLLENTIITKIRREITDRTVMFMCGSFGPIVGSLLKASYYIWSRTGDEVTSSISENPVSIQASNKTFRDILDSIGKVDLFEGDVGQVFESIRSLLSKTAGEVGTTIGVVYSSFWKGLISTNKENAEVIADMLDDRVNRNNRS